MEIYLLSHRETLDGAERTVLSGTDLRIDCLISVDIAEWFWVNKNLSKCVL
jgi:hypothetical protein